MLSKTEKIYTTVRHSFNYFSILNYCGTAVVEHVRSMRRDVTGIVSPIVEVINGGINESLRV